MADDPLSQEDPFNLPYWNCRCVLIPAERVIDTVHVRRNTDAGPIALFRADVAIARGSSAIIRWLLCHAEYKVAGPDCFAASVYVDDVLTPTIAAMQYLTIGGVIALHNHSIAKRLFNLRRLRDDPTQS